MKRTLLVASALASVVAAAAVAAEVAQPPVKEVFVSPAGTPTGKGTKESPVDLKTAFSDAQLVPPGTTVWIAGGRYELGMFQPAAGVRGTKDAPVIYRAVPGERATVVGGFELRHDHVWLWGLEIVGPNECGVNLKGGSGVKLINLIIHDAGPAEKPQERKPSGQGIGGWDVGDDHEYYGNIIYHNGWNTLDHGIYTQNTARHTTKRIVDNIIFENAGFGIHAYGQAPTLCGFHVEGNICFATSRMPRNPQESQVNILLGGSKPISKVVLKSNCTWHPDPGSKRGVDIGYKAQGCQEILVEDNYLMGGANALELNGVLDATVRNNTFWAPAGMVKLAPAPGADRKNFVFEGNTYIQNGRFDLAKWRAETGSAKTDRVVPGRKGQPTGVHVVTRVNRYEPERIHIAVYNWDKRPSVRIDIKGLLKRGDGYRVVNVLDYFGKPVAQGKAEVPYIELRMRGHRYEPDFGAYVLFRERAPAAP